VTNEAPQDSTMISVISEVMATDQLIRARLAKALPKGLALSHFSVLNHLCHVDGERSPAHLARTFNVTKGAMTNTFGKLEIAGYIHIRPDWDDARRKWIGLSGAGRAVREDALRSVAPLFDEITRKIGSEQLRETLPLLRDLRLALS
jgi:DNA-binding MarR family transcriptional regulator